MLELLDRADKGDHDVGDQADALALQVQLSLQYTAQHQGREGLQSSREGLGREDMREREEGDRPQGGEQMDRRESEWWGGEKWGKSMRQELTAMTSIPSFLPLAL